MDKTKPNSIHDPVIEIKLKSGGVLVKELSWPDALHLYTRMIAQSKELFVNGELVMTPERLTSALAENVELGTWLALKSTGKDQTWLETLSLGEMLDVVTAAAQLNVQIIVDRLKKAKAQFAEMLGRGKP